MSAKTTINIASHLPAMAREHPDDLAVVIQRAGGYEELTLAALDRECDAIARGLERIGIRRGVRTVLMVKPGREFFALTFALFKVGAVPVFVDPGMGIKSLKACLAEAQPLAFIGIPKAHVARLLFGWSRDTLRIKVTVGRRLFWGGYTLNGIREDVGPTYRMVAPPAGATAAILFTSGSTGLPKGAVYTHEVFNAQVAALRDDYGITPGERDLATFPLFALFGPALGMAAVIPDMDASKPITADPRRLIAAINDYKTTNMFASPALIDRVERYGAEQALAGNPVQLPSLRRVISAGAPAKPESLAGFAKLLAPGVEVLNSYGATEALPVSFIGSTELLTETRAATAAGAGVCVGKPVGAATVKIMRITDGPEERLTPELLAATGEVGEIAVAGPMVTREYFRRPAATEQAKIQGEAGGGFFHRMGDLGYFDGQGRLWMCGRKAHRVVTAGGTLFTIACERIFDEHPRVRRTALVGVQGGHGVKPVLCVETLPGVAASEQEDIRRELGDIGSAHENTRTIGTFLFHPRFPVDVRHNAKIFREQLTIWAEQKIGGNR